MVRSSRIPLSRALLLSTAGIAFALALSLTFGSIAATPPLEIHKTLVDLQILTGPVGPISQRHPIVSALDPYFDAGPPVPRLFEIENLEARGHLTLRRRQRLLIRRMLSRR
jgi:hypothetical protein